MKKVNLPANKMDKFAGQWVAIDPTKDRIIAAADTLKEIMPLVSRSIKDKTPDEKIPYSFKVPRRDEGPYILCPTRILL